MVTPRRIVPDAPAHPFGLRQPVHEGPHTDTLDGAADGDAQAFRGGAVRGVWHGGERARYSTCIFAPWLGISETQHSSSAGDGSNPDCLCAASGAPTTGRLARLGARGRRDAQGGELAQDLLDGARARSRARAARGPPPSPPEAGMTPTRRTWRGPPPENSSEKSASRSPGSCGLDGQDGLLREELRLVDEPELAGLTPRLHGVHHQHRVEALEVHGEICAWRPELEQLDARAARSSPRGASRRTARRRHRP